MLSDSCSELLDSIQKAVAKFQQEVEEYAEDDVMRYPAEVTKPLIDACGLAIWQPYSGDYLSTLVRLAFGTMHELDAPPTEQV